MLTFLTSSWCLFFCIQYVANPHLADELKDVIFKVALPFAPITLKSSPRWCPSLVLRKNIHTSCLIDRFIIICLWSGHLKVKNATLSILLVISDCAIWISRARWGILQFFHSLSTLILVHCSVYLTRTSSFCRATLNRNTKEVLWHIPSIEVHALSYSISMELTVLTVLLVMWRSYFLKGHQGNRQRVLC